MSNGVLSLQHYPLHEIACQIAAANRGNAELPLISFAFKSTQKLHLFASYVALVPMDK